VAQAPACGLSRRFDPPFPHFVAFAFRRPPRPDKLRSMFQAETHTAKRLHLVQGGNERTRILKGVSDMNAKNMNEYKFAEYPSNSSVASGVTLLVSAWFLVAAGAILAEPASPYTRGPVMQAAVSQEARLIPAVAPAAPQGGLSRPGARAGLFSWRRSPWP
jgi:hypothetical protein